MKKALFFTLALILVMTLFASNVFAEDKMKALSFDTFYKTEVGGAEQTLKDGEAGKFLADNPQAYLPGAVEKIGMRGWAGDTAAITTFGYKIDGGAFVEGNFKQPTEEAVKGAGGEFAERYKVDVPVKELATGKHLIEVFAKLDDGRILSICAAEITILNADGSNPPTGSAMLATVTLALAVVGMAFVLFKKESKYRV